MDTNENEKRKGFQKLLIFFVILIVLALIAGFAYARYITKLNGQVEAQVANWTFKVNGSTNDTFEIDLANTRAGITQEANVESGYIAPGTAGAFTINIDASNSDVSLTYDLIIDSSNIPKNLVFYSDSNMKNVLFYADSKIEFGDYIKYDAQNKTRSKTLYWRWPYETGITADEISENDANDSEWMGDEISLSINVVVKQVDKEPNYFAKKANIGDYVNYVDKNGNTIKCVVLYNEYCKDTYDTNYDETSHGVQIIAVDMVKEEEITRLIALGANDPRNTIEGEMGSLERAQKSYNRAIFTLNEYSMEYLNIDFSYDSRCVGSVPTNKNSENNSLYTSNYYYMRNYNDKNKSTDSNYDADCTRLEKLGILKTANNNVSYWLASHYIGSSTNNTYFAIRRVSNSFGLSNYYLWNINVENITNSFSPEYGFRPVFYLNPNVKITGGDGSESSPYELGK